MSIRLRLTLLYTAVLAVTLLLFSLGLYLQQRQSRYRDIDRSLQARAAALSTASVQHPDTRSASPPSSTTRRDFPPFWQLLDPKLRRSLVAQLNLSKGDLAAFSDPTIIQEVMDGRGQVIDNRGQVVPPSGDAGILPQPKNDGRHFETVTINHDDYRMWVQPFDAPVVAGATAPQFTPPLTILTAYSLAHTDSDLANLRNALLLSAAACLLTAAGAGWLLARGALRPIDRVTAAAHAIGAQQDFQRRLGHDGPNDEVGRLASTFNGMLDSLAAAHERLQRALEAQRRFVADASHELRTPLTTISGNVELLRIEGAQSPEEQQEALADIASEAERMRRLVQNLLALARADGGLAIPRRPVDMQPLIIGVVQKASRLHSGVDLRLGETAPATVLGDADYLVQLLLILVDNALKYTPAGGSVTVSAALSASSLCIAVRDTGIGIAPQQLGHIFERFYRADPSRHGEGTGLGLAIAGWIAAELGGRIDVVSEPDRGSTFSVVLPATPRPAAKASEPDSDDDLPTPPSVPEPVSV